MKISTHVLKVLNETVELISILLCRNACIYKSKFSINAAYTLKAISPNVSSFVVNGEA